MTPDQLVRYRATRAADHAKQIRARFGDVDDSLIALDYRAIAALRSLDVSTVGAIASIRLSQLWRLKGVGLQTVKDICRAAELARVEFAPEDTTRKPEPDPRHVALLRLDRSIVGIEKYLTRLRAQRETLATALGVVGKDEGR